MRLLHSAIKKLKDISMSDPVHGDGLEVKSDKSKLEALEEIDEVRLCDECNSEMDKISSDTLGKEFWICECGEWEDD